MKLFQKRTLNYYVMKINRIVVWVLLALMIIYIITGYGLTKPNLIYLLTGGIIDYRVAIFLHNTLDVPLFIFLFVHVVIEIKFSLMRWGFKNQKLLNLLMAMLGLFFLIFFLIVDVI